MILALKRALYRFILSPARLLYWRLFKPKTFGAMMLVVDASGDKLLLIRHAYGRRHVWTMPGGGYWPSREAPEDAAVRETWEEVGVTVTDVIHLGQMQGSSFSKRDTREIYQGTLHAQTPVVTAEIEEQRWVTWAEAEALPLSKVAEFALQRRGGGTGKCDEI